MIKNIYNLKLHEILQTPDFQVMRVASGWVYRYWNYEKKDYYNDSTFVPFSNKFDTKVPEPTPMPSNRS